MCAQAAEGGMDMDGQAARRSSEFFVTESASSASGAIVFEKRRVNRNALFMNDSLGAENMMKRERVHSRLVLSRTTAYFT